MEGGLIVSAISKNTFCLIVKEHGKETTKIKKAKEGIIIRNVALDRSMIF